MWGPGAGQTPPCTRRGLGILLALLCQAQLSQGQVYRIHVAPHVTVQQGLCVLLPCHFTADFESPGSVYKYWFLRDTDWHRSVPVVSTNPDRPPQEPRGRIRLAGEAEDDCSLSISDVRAEDRDRYYFRFEKGESKYSYLEIQPLVNVTELRDQPVLRVPEVLKPGQPVNVTCQAPGTCSGTPPQITWTGGFNYSAMNVSEPQGNGSVSYSSVLRFTPTLAHDGKELGCTVTYPAVGVSTRRALRLHVGYAPELLPGGNCTVWGSGPGGAATCYCAAEGNPPPRLQWRLPNRTLPGDFKGPELRAKSWVRGPAVSGELRGPAGALANVSCAAANAHGQSQAELPLVPAGDNNLLLIVSSGVIGGVLLLTGLVIVVYKIARARKDGEEGPSSYGDGGNREQQPSPMEEKPNRVKKKEQFNPYKTKAGGEVGNARLHASPIGLGAKTEETCFFPGWVGALPWKAGLVPVPQQSTRGRCSAVVFPEVLARASTCL
ncbi:sialic acid-binding Ig-like lectin 13 isoform X2 [Pelodiscus sinensis]|uniref:sialic acid-binding Ig-like lectin 13 isoform X2 n=1 Tax=Pelodiscus sinensis TaxID=13735 RepID=UPI003F6CF743